MLVERMKQIIAYSWWYYGSTLYHINRDGTTGTTNKMSYSTFYIGIGSGKNTLMDDALWLEEPIDEGYEIIGRSQSFDEKKDAFFNVMMTIKNTGSEKLIINESCIYIGGATGTGLPTGGSWMLAREVLNESIIVDPGKSCVLAMNLTWPT